MSRPVAESRTEGAESTCNVSGDTGWKELTGPRAESTHSSRGAREIHTGNHTHAGQNHFARVDTCHEHGD